VSTCPAVDYLFGEEPPAPPAPRKWTEREILDLLRERYTREVLDVPSFIYAEHVRSGAGFGDFHLRTADAIAIDLWPSRGNHVHGFEVKTSRADWLTELRDPAKAEAVRRYCHRWWLVAPVEVVRDDLPEGWGFLTITDGRLRVKKSAPVLTPEPITHSFLAALSRALIRTNGGTQ